MCRKGSDRLNVSIEQIATTLRKKSGFGLFFKIERHYVTESCERDKTVSLFMKVWTSVDS